MYEIPKWYPNASIINLIKRASIIKEIRHFFYERKVLEVETPAMSKATVTDVNLMPFQTRFAGCGENRECDLWLITSPEYHMKRLLAAGSGPIYQISRCFRNKEAGRYHNPEFTMLEWYRPDYDMYLLMNEVSDLLKKVLNCNNPEFFSYQEIFLRYLKVDPLSAKKEKLYEIAETLNEMNLNHCEESNDLVQLLFTLGVEPYIGKDKPTFIYYFPSNQAALAKINTQDPRVAERFEVYYKGIELANGFCELTDRHEQYQRFKQDHLCRDAQGLPQYPIDTYFLEALAHGLSDCSGVALGLDRLIMLALNSTSLDEVISFTIDRC